MSIVAKTAVRKQYQRKTVEKSGFDLYIMSMSYQPEFCYQHRQEQWPGCEHPRTDWKTHLTIHGLWPQYLNGSWPESCTNETLSEKVIATLHTRLEQWWPNVRATHANESEYLVFWNHEWSKHGTCSGLSQLAYFTAALNHFIPTPPLVAENYGKSVSKEELLRAYDNNPTAANATTILVCTHGNYLSEVRWCHGKDPDFGGPSYRMPCPPSMVLQWDSACQGSEIILSRFPGNNSSSMSTTIAVT